MFYLSFFKFSFWRLCIPGRREFGRGEVGLDDVLLVGGSGHVVREPSSRSDKSLRECAHFLEKREE